MPTCPPSPGRHQLEPAATAAPAAPNSAHPLSRRRFMTSGAVATVALAVSPSLLAGVAGPAAQREASRLRAAWHRAVAGVHGRAVADRYDSMFVELAEYYAPRAGTPPYALKIAVLEQNLVGVVGAIEHMVGRGV